MLGSNNTVTWCQQLSRVQLCTCVCVRIDKGKSVHLLGISLADPRGRQGCMPPFRPNYHAIFQKTLAK